MQGYTLKVADYTIKNAELRNQLHNFNFDALDMRKWLRVLKKNHSVYDF